MNYTQIDIEKKIRRVLPAVLRIPFIIKFLITLLKPVSTLWGSFLTFRTNLLSTLDVNITVGSIQAKLRTLYPEVGGFKVYIKTTYDDKERTFDTNLSEHHLSEYEYFLDETAPKTYDYFLNEFEQEYDYIAYVPEAYTAKEQDIRSFLNRYRAAGMLFNIVFKNLT
ncbi:MAG: hypothetical protein R2800_09805 [Flavipsychrobacter sp.]